MATLQSSQHPRRHHQPGQNQSPSAHHYQAPSPQPLYQAPPLYLMGRGIKTITDLYREWYDGLANDYPAQIDHHHHQQLCVAAHHHHRNRCPISPKKGSPGSTCHCTILPNIMTKSSNRLGALGTHSRFQTPIWYKNYFLARPLVLLLLPFLTSGLHRRPSFCLASPLAVRLRSTSCHLSGSPFVHLSEADYPLTSTSHQRQLLHFTVPMISTPT
ncbi:hypothetical protein [Absidia glauca]|uniref:Ndc10 domain-containing protein n=1 Tax=Absidia glauca TaxID=4829 RepID=A0A168LYK0_ABSGL|nr:hypothetical protein [Absidia glauca]